MTTRPNDLQAYQEIVVNDIKTILSELNNDLPWLVADIAISVQNRIGANNPFTQKILVDVLADLSEEDMLDLSAECLPDSDTKIRQATTGIMGGIIGERIRTIFAKPVFTLDEEPSSACSPCDGGENEPIAMGILGVAAKAQYKKIKIAQHIVEDIEKLMAHKKAMSLNAEAFKDEIAGIKVILEVIDTRCQK